MRETKSIAAMIRDALAKEFSAKKILILGYGAEGKSTATLLREMNTHSTMAIADMRENLAISHADILYLGEHYLQALSEYDLVIRSPGIPLSKHIWEECGSRITSQIELFLKYFRGKTIGITGTKGKTSTSSLLASILEAAGKKPLLMGNIGIPVFERIDSCSVDRPVVLELSSHQLQHIRYAPTLSVLLNIYKEHLEYYDSFDDYASAKYRILLSDNDTQSLAFVHQSLKSRIHALENTREIHWIGDNLEILRELNLPPYLESHHQRINSLFAITIARSMGISMENIQEGITRFQGLPFRMEDVGTFSGIRFINDSASTIPEAAISAIQSLPDISTLIIGGMERDVPLTELVQFLVSTPQLNIICIPDTGKKLYPLLQEANYPLRSLFQADTVHEAVTIAMQITPRETTCLFSPAAASYHAYKNFMERGAAFNTALETTS